MSKLKKIFSAGIINGFTVITGYSIYKFANIFLDKLRPNKKKLLEFKDPSDVGINNLETYKTKLSEEKHMEELDKQILASTAFSVYNLPSRKVAMIFEKLFSPKSEFTFSRAASILIYLPGLNYLRNKSLKILSVGCRDKIELIALQKRFPYSEIIGLDLIAGKDSGIIAGDMHKLPFPENTFDIVVSTHSLEHALDYKIVANEFVRVAKENSYFLIEVPSYEKDGENPTWIPEGADNWDYHNPSCLNSIFEGKTDQVISDFDDPDIIKVCLKVNK